MCSHIKHLSVTHDRKKISNILFFFFLRDWVCLTAASPCMFSCQLRVLYLPLHSICYLFLMTKKICLGLFQFHLDDHTDSPAHGDWRRTPFRKLVSAGREPPNTIQSRSYLPRLLITSCRGGLSGQ